MLWSVLIPAWPAHAMCVCACACIMHAPRHNCMYRILWERLLPALPCVLLCACVCVLACISIYTGFINAMVSAVPVCAYVKALLYFVDILYKTYTKTCREWMHVCACVYAYVREIWHTKESFRLNASKENTALVWACKRYRSDDHTQFLKIAPYAAMSSPLEGTLLSRHMVSVCFRQAKHVLFGKPHSKNLTVLLNTHMQLFHMNVLNSTNLERVLALVWLQYLTFEQLKHMKLDDDFGLKHLRFRVDQNVRPQRSQSKERAIGRFLRIFRIRWVSGRSPLQNVHKCPVKVANANQGGQHK